MVEYGAAIEAHLPHVSYIALRMLYPTEGRLGRYVKVVGNLLEGGRHYVGR